ncbi:hypothetical protein WJX84_008096 [Apatococcus fuscideae]|uniref:ER lumen protein retaining receptor n=1 Tax=Apatococcus fuscideae TaxID=2026836 RepID=A0AAW1TEA6_9CHLO
MYASQPNNLYAAPARGGSDFLQGSSDAKLGQKVKDPLLAASRWLKRRSDKEKAALGCAAGVLALFLLWLVIENHDNLFIMGETVHFIGIGLLLWKLLQKKNCGGLSLRSQELTALFLAVRLFCSFMMEYDIHTILDLLTLVATLWVIYIVRFQLYETYQPEQDSIHDVYVVVPCLVAAVLAHPGTNHKFLLRVMWAFCVYVEAVSVLPQLRMMQNAKIIDGDSFLLQAIGSGLWPTMVLISELVQTFILADFCWYYVKSYAEGTGVIHLAAGIV